MATTNALMNRFSAMAAWMDSEGLVNGMWDGILNLQFPTSAGAFLIGPEVNTINNDYRADLAVYQVAGGAGALTRRCVAVYEGKREGGDTWAAVLNQCKNWAAHQEQAVIATNQCVWFVGARGKLAKVWVCKRNGAALADFHTKSLKVSDIGVWSNGVEDNSADGFVFDLTNGNHQVWLAQALAYAYAHLLNTYSWT